MKWVLTSVASIFFVGQFQAQLDVNWDSLLSRTPALSKVGNAPEKYKLQIICTKVEVDKSGHNHFKTDQFRASDSSYFYPASIVKLPASIFAAEKVHQLSRFGITMTTDLKVDSAFQCQSRLDIDTYTNDSTASIGEFIEKALVVSDNPSYSRLYEFVGPAYFAQRFSEMHMERAIIRTRFSSCDSSANRHTNPFHFLQESGDTVYSQPEGFYGGLYPPPLPTMLVGKSHESNGRIIAKPKSFEKANALPLADMHAIMMELIYPESQPFKYEISEEQRAYLRRMLTISPRQAENRKIASKKDFHDNYTNYLFFGQENSTRNTSMDVCNIVGLAYGFMTDICYVKDTITGTEFFLSATLYLNERNKFGSGNYEYSQIGFPFMKELGWSVKSELEKP